MKQEKMKTNDEENKEEKKGNKESRKLFDVLTGQSGHLSLLHYPTSHSPLIPPNSVLKCSLGKIIYIAIPTWACRVYEGYIVHYCRYVLECMRISI